MSACETCGAEGSNDLTCRYCGSTVCTAHILPERHGCSAFITDQSGSRVVDDSSNSVNIDPDEDDTRLRTECEDCRRVGEDTLRYRCTYCGDEFCVRHRTPERHECPARDLATKPGGTSFLFRTPKNDSDDDTENEGKNENSPSNVTSSVAETCSSSTGSPETIESVETFGRTPSDEEIIDERSPDVAPDGSIRRGERKSGSVNSELEPSTRSRSSQHPAIQPVVTIAVLLIVVAVLLYLVV